MREILFRGQTRKYGEKVNMRGEKVPGNWVYGGICPGSGTYSIIYGSKNFDDLESKYSVYSDTICEYTGLKDKNGMKIFEGDIVRDDENNIWIVKFEDGNFLTVVDLKIFHDCDSCLCCINEESEVIGNIFDNPEL